MEDDGGITEDEIDSAVDVTFTEKLAEGVDVQSILVSDEAALVEDGEVWITPQRHRLVFRNSGIVLERDTFSYEIVAFSNWKLFKTNLIN